MLKLIERVRQLRQSGKPVDLLAFADGGALGYARMLATTQASRKLRVLALVGNVHANRAELNSYTGAPPMGALLAEHGRTVSLNASYPGGKAWLCMDQFGCGPQALTGSPKALPAGRISLVEARRDKVWLYDGWYDLGELSASPPARPAPTPPPRSEQKTS
ncbi:hypothetical protein FNU76_08645 [Chitinimonas arctica]|uniref:Uncharacterized protein n=1 Tax=Chitinimonas arctica TaxID=2594795 RepID=A0A516SE33_9NEIS|nr:hypothetical protein [Chitinimonas arctica]QDQ26427.1 hypothetical protein FNU76_08645 [Chitinimonas arctica]